MLAAVSKPLVRLVDRYLPDPYIFVLILTLVVFVAAVLVERSVAARGRRHVGRRASGSC